VRSTSAGCGLSGAPHARAPTSSARVLPAQHSPSVGPAPPPRAALPPPALVQAEAHGAGGAAGAGAASVLLAHVPARSCSASSAHATHSPVRRESTSPRLHAQAAPATVLRTPAAAGSQTGARSAGSLSAGGGVGITC
jgi:hypothetical protein